MTKLANEALETRDTPAHLRFVEPGDAFAELSGLQRTPRTATAERYDVIVIGGGQAGLSVGYHLQQRGLSFVILDASERIGDVWRKRWDSLKLFTPAWLDGLDGLPFPAPSFSFPTKDAMADYLESYAKHFELPVHTKTRVDSLAPCDGGYVVRSGEKEYRAAQVVVAMASYQKKRVPAFAAELDREIVQLHSVDYKNPAQLRDGGVLIAGAGNSGSELAMELARTQRVCMAGRDVGAVPFRIDGFWARLILTRLVLRGVFHRLLTIRTPLGRKARPAMLSKGGPLIRVKPSDLERAGVERAPRIAGVRDGKPVLEDGRVLDVKNVIWCTGFEPGFSWIELPIFDERGVVAHEGGVVPRAPGLYFVGLGFLFSFSSSMIHGVGRDAARIASAAAQHKAAAHAARQGR